VTIVSPSWGSVLEREFGIGPKLHVVSNGYDAEELASIKPQEFGHLAIVYTGRLVPPKRTISPVFEVLRRLDAVARDDWKFHYYGRDGHRIWQEAARLGVSRRVIVHGSVSRLEALAAVKGAAVAVVITSVTEHATTADNGMVTAKIFEAIGLGTPVLLIAPPESDANTVVEITGLACTRTANDADGIGACLRHVIDGHPPEPKDPAAYAWENLVGGLDRVLRTAMRR
jgi:glycosyltransferase involved in cell wall biosynthesis